MLIKSESDNFNFRTTSRDDEQIDILLAIRHKGGANSFESTQLSLNIVVHHV